jgi:hypothetical protein
MMGNTTAVATEVITAERMTTEGEPPQAHRILGRRWTTDQLYALAARDLKVQRHVEHGAARIALAAHFPAVDTAAIRSMVIATMGTIAGTYWMVAALHLAQLALAHPELLTPTQYGLLLAPLEAAEAVPAAIEAALAA